MKETFKTSKEAQGLHCLLNRNSAEMSNNEEPTPIFPPEVIIEILSWLRLKYIIQLQLVCKQWQAFVRDHYFIEKHMSRSPVVWHCYNCTNSGNSPQNKPDLTTFTYIHGCDGLILVTDTSSGKYIIWNPATRRVLELPDPHNGAYGPAIYFAPATGNYRIVSFYEDKETWEEGCEILTPGQNQAWRRLTFPHTKVNEDRKKERVSIISTGAAVHCVRVLKVGIVEIVSLDTETECLTVNHLPRELYCNFKTVCELEWNGKLGFVELIGRNLEVMELEDYKKGRWCETKKVIPLSFRKAGDEKRRNLFPLFAKEGEIWFWLKSERIFTYAIETERVADVTKSKFFSVKNKLYAYKPSLVTFKGMKPDDMLERLQNFKFD